MIINFLPWQWWCWLNTKRPFDIEPSKTFSYCCCCCCCLWWCCLSRKHKISLPFSQRAPKFNDILVKCILILSRLLWMLIFILSTKKKTQNFHWKLKTKFLHSLCRFFSEFKFHLNFIVVIHVSRCAFGADMSLYIRSIRSLAVLLFLHLKHALLNF